MPRAGACRRMMPRQHLGIARAAEQDHAEAQNNLGIMYGGEGVPQDDFGRCAGIVERRNRATPKGRLGSGTCTTMVKVLPQDYTEALRWYRQAAEQGDAETTGGQTSLGIMYDYGEGVPQNYTDRCAIVRAEQGYARAQFRLWSCTSPAEACRRTMFRRKMVQSCRFSDFERAEIAR